MTRGGGGGGDEGGSTDGGGEINQFSRITNKASAVISFDELWEVRERSNALLIPPFKDQYDYVSDVAGRQTCAAVEIEFKKDPTPSAA